MTAEQAARTEPHLRLALRAMYLAFEDAGYDAAGLRGSRTGVFLGLASAPVPACLAAAAWSGVPAARSDRAGDRPTMAADRLARFLGLRGPSMVVDSGCSASLAAVHQAKNALLLEDCDAAVVAGSRIVADPAHRRPPVGGAGPGEGAGAVVLKRLRRARSEGDRIYAVIRGSTVNHDTAAAEPGGPDQDRAAESGLLAAAWDAGMDPRTLGYWEVDGTATGPADAVESAGLPRALRPHPPGRGSCAIGTVTANIGHLGEGSGVMGLIKVALALHRKQIPPVAAFDYADTVPEAASGPFRVPTNLEAWEARDVPRRAAVSASGLGGTTCHVLLEEHSTDPPTAVPADEPPRLFTLSARNEASLRLLVRAYAGYFAAGRFDGASLAEVCYSAARSRSSHRCRLALVVTGLAHLGERLTALAAGRADSEPVYASVEALDRRPANGFARAAQSAEVTGRLHRSAARYVDGQDIDLRTLYQPEPPRLTGLPGYQFDERRCRIEIPAIPAQLPALATGPDPLTHEVEFVPTRAAPVTVSGAGEQAEVLALVDPGTEAESMLIRAGFAGARFLRLPGSDSDDYQRLARLATAEGATHLVFALGFEDRPAADLEQLELRIRKNLHGLFLLAQGLMAAGASLSLIVLTRRALAAEAGEPGVVTENGALIGLGRTISRAYPHVSVSCVDVDGAVDAAALGQEVLAAEPGVHVLRGEIRYREQFAELPRIDPHPAHARYLRPGGTYLITGGTGGLGLEVARLFATRQPGANLVLLSRSGAPPREQWPKLAERTGLAATLLEIEELGAKVEVLRADAGDPRTLTEAVRAVQERYGRIDGIVHAAGTAAHCGIASHTDADFSAAIRPKLFGAFLLDALTTADRPDFVAYFSSAAAVFPAADQAGQAAAGYYLDNRARAHAGSDPRCHVIAFDWVPWKGTGAPDGRGASTDAMFEALTPESGIAVFEAGLRSDRHRVFGGRIHYEGDFVHALPSYHLELEPAMLDKIEQASERRARRRELAAERLRRDIDAVAVRLTGRAHGRYTPAEWLVARCWARVLGSAQFAVDADFFGLGGDAETGRTLMAALSACTGARLTTSDLLAERTIEALARVVGEALPADPG
jgi:acyl transferase domain-containing protein